MKPAPFELARPETLASALDLLAGRPEQSRPLAGGQTLVPVLNLRLASPALLVDLNRIVELRGIRRDGRTVRIGAMTRQAALLSDPVIEECLPLLRAGARHIGHVQTRARGTVGGSLAHADPSAELPLLAVVLHATLTLRSRDSAREIPAREFFVDGLTTALRPGELLTEISIPVPEAGAPFAFREVARRHGDFAIAAVAIQRYGDRIAAGIGGLAATPRLCPSLATAASPVFDRSLLPGLVEREIRDSDALADVHASPAYRRRVSAVLLRECLDEVLR